MTKEEIKRLMKPKSGRPFDMRPRLGALTYVELLEVADEVNMAENPLITAIVRCWLDENGQNITPEIESRLKQALSAA